MNNKPTITETSDSTVTNKEPHKDADTGDFHFSAVDTLNKYGGLDTLVHLDSVSFFVGKAYGINHGLIPVSYSQYVIYTQTNNKWVITDRFYIDRYNKPVFIPVTIKSMEGVNSRTLMVMSGSKLETVLVYDKDLRIFKHNPHISRKVN